ncbi:unnamed protein product [Euphydryas editha]|uniref:Uncharacterized protein n=1 Tax=Euphydryas editha TaxID=104508 RepID=A0AAU9UQR4_EUPED|nr:unnamed protein product [Euphydryas editha]
MLFADELKQIVERYMFGICPQPYKSRWSQMVSKKNATTPTCDLDTDQQDLAGRLATLALRAHSVSRTDCSRFGAALANTLGELARTASNRHGLAFAANEKKRKLSKSQKAKIAAKQRTALAVKKKAAALAAAAAAKMAAS